MPFPESVKLAVKKRSHFRCCLCHIVGVEVHHIISQEEDCADTEDNAAPLCPSCHEIYGANPQKRKFVREARDFWYELLERQHPEGLKQIEDLIKGIPSKSDIQQMLRDTLATITENEGKQFQQRLWQAEQDLSKSEATISQLGSRLATADFIGAIAEGMLFKSAERVTSRTAEAVREICRTFAELGKWKATMSLSETLISVHAGEPAPLDLHDRLFYYSVVLFKCVIDFDVIAAMAAAFVPLLLQEYREHPNVSPQETIKLLFKRMNSEGFLPELTKRGRGDLKHLKWEQFGQ